MLTNPLPDHNKQNIDTNVLKNSQKGIKKMKRVPVLDLGMDDSYESVRGRLEPTERIQVGGFGREEEMGDKTVRFYGGAQQNGLQGQSDTVMQTLYAYGRQDLAEIYQLYLDLGHAYSSHYPEPQILEKIAQIDLILKPAQQQLSHWQQKLQQLVQNIYKLKQTIQALQNPIQNSITEYGKTPQMSAQCHKKEIGKFREQIEYIVSSIRSRCQRWRTTGRLASEGSGVQGVSIYKEDESIGESEKPVKPFQLNPEPQPIPSQTINQLSTIYTLHTQSHKFLLQMLFSDLSFRKNQQNYKQKYQVVYSLYKKYSTIQVSVSKSQDIGVLVDSLCRFVKDISGGIEMVRALWMK